MKKDGKFNHFPVENNKNETKKLSARTIEREKDGKKCLKSLECEKWIINNNEIVSFAFMNHILYTRIRISRAMVIRICNEAHKAHWKMGKMF